MPLKDLISKLHENTKLEIYSKKFSTTVFTGVIKDFDHFVTQDMMRPYIDNTVEYCYIRDNVLVITCG